MKITEFRLGEIPFLAIDRLLDFKVFDPDIGRRMPLFDDGYLPAESWPSEAGKKGRSQPEIATAVVYWYPSYIDMLYSMAIDMGQRKANQPTCMWDNYLQPLEAYWFRRLFKEASERLDRLQKGDLKLNHVDEILIKNGKVRL